MFVSLFGYEELEIGQLVYEQRASSGLVLYLSYI